MHSDYYMGRETGRQQMQETRYLLRTWHITESAVVPAVRSSTSIAGQTRQECLLVLCRGEPPTLRRDR